MNIRVYPVAALVTCLAIVGPRWQASAADVVQGSEFSIGKYWIGAAFSDQGKFQYCGISTTYNSNTLLAFLMTKNFDDFAISLSEPDWRLPVGQILYATISLDGKWSDSYKGVAAGTDQITFHFRPDADFVKALALGRTLRIASTKQKWQFNLLETENAIPQLVKCAAAYSDDAGASNNPFDTQGQPYSATKKKPVANPFDSQ